MCSGVYAFRDLGWAGQAVHNIRTGVLKSRGLNAPGPESTGKQVLGPESTSSAWHQDRSPEEPHTWCTRTGVNWRAGAGTGVNQQCMASGPES